MANIDHDDTYRSFINLVYRTVVSDPQLEISRGLELLSLPWVLCEFCQGRS